MANATTYDGSLRELAHRVNDGVEVTLAWSKPDNRIIVSVYDAKTMDFFELETASENALDAFHHPYAYAAFQGIEYHAADSVAEDALAA